MHIETKVIHSGREISPFTGSVTPGIEMSTTFERGDDGSYPKGFIYSRSHNPTRHLLEECITELELGTRAAAFSSGMAAIMAVAQALEPGAEVVIPRDIYHGTARLFREIMIPWGLKVNFVDFSNIEQLKQYVTRNVRMIFVETPSNPLLKLTDIKAISELARKADAVLVCDNTLSTPISQRPLSLGADLVIHSSTKYLGGHGDVTGGLVVTREETDFFDKVRFLQQNGGAVPSPFDCWLIMRGIRTLAYRVRAHSHNALKVAEYLRSHSKVREVFYPELTGIFRDQMALAGGLVSFRVKGSVEEAFSVAARTKLFTRATSFGSYESLIEHRASMEGNQNTVPDDLLRLSVGLEHHADLIDDLNQALTP
jgi:cystathionine gamma-synthase